MISHQGVIHPVIRKVLMPLIGRSLGGGGGEPVPDPYRDLILSRSPLVWYRNNEPSGNQAADSSGNGHHGLYQATPDAVLDILDPLPSPTADVAGILYGQPGPGSDPVIEITTVTAGMRCFGVTIPAGVTAFTIEMWIMPTNIAAILNGSIGVGGWFTEAGFTTLIAPYSDNQTYFDDCGQSSPYRLATVGQVESNNVWRHFAGVVNGNVMQIYIDGVLKASLSDHVRPNVACNIFTLGYYYRAKDSAHTLGRYGDCMVYLSALTEAQIIENRNARLAGAPVVLGVEDNFDGPDGPLVGRIPNIVSAGHPWQMLSGTSANQVIQGNKAILVSAAGEWASIDTGLSDGTILASFSLPNVAAAIALVPFRVVDISNYWQVNISIGDVRIYKFTAGVAAEVGVASIQSAANTVQSLYIELNGSHIKITRASALLYEATDAYNASSTKHGIGGFNGATGDAVVYEHFQMQTGLHAPAVVVLAATSKGTSAGGGNTDPINTIGAKLIVLNLAYYTGGTLQGVHDSQGNVYTPLDAHMDVAGGVIQQLWYCENPATGPAHQFQINGATIFASVQAAAFGGEITAAPFDQQSGGHGTGSSLAIGPVGQSGVHSLVVAGLGFSDTTPGPVTGDGGFNIVGTTPYQFGQYFGGALAFKISDAQIVHHITWDIAAPMSGIAAGLATFQPAPAAPVTLSESPVERAASPSARPKRGPRHRRKPS